uniref:sugar nucleotide-binding protein n=1 Tax=Enterobacter hormaechei TaxID=158836 RepID=UPI00203BA1E9
VGWGGPGEVGLARRRARAPRGTGPPPPRSGTLPDGSACETADFGQPESLPALLDRLQPSIVVNAAAYTAVDRAEQEVDAAFAANAQAPGVIARWCAAHGVPFVHYSTDYVFDGQGTVPYHEDEPT